MPALEIFGFFESMANELLPNRHPSPLPQLSKEVAKVLRIVSAKASMNPADVDS